VDFPQEQIDELKPYCDKLRAFTECGVTFLLLEGLRLPAGCMPSVCDALLCPMPKDGYPSRLYFSELIKGLYTRNWNKTDARIGERNWVAFSWMVNLAEPTIAQLLVAHLTGFCKEK
jgi:hypothetical protein